MEKLIANVSFGNFGDTESLQQELEAMAFTPRCVVLPLLKRRAKRFVHFTFDHNADWAN